MDWINIHTSVLDSAEFLTAEPVDRGTWLCLQRYCCGQENGGQIIGAAAWSDRIWQQLCRVTLKEVRRPSQLWKWEGDTLIVSFYNNAAQGKVQKNRTVGAAGGHASAEARRAKQQTATMQSSEIEPHASTEKEPHGSTDAISVSVASGGTKGKERKGKEKEGNTPYPQGGVEAGGLNSLHPQSKRPRSGKTGSVLPSEQSPQVGGRMLLVGALMRRQEGTAWTSREFEAFRAARLDDCDGLAFTDQIETLRPYYHSKIAREKDFRRRDLQTLLNNWPSEIDRARAWNRERNDGITKV